MAEVGEDIPMEPIDPRDEDDDQQETPFDGDDWDTEHRSHHFNPDEETRPLIDPVERRFADKEKAEDFLRSVFVDPRVDQILCGVDDYDRVWVSLTGKRATKYVHQPSGRFLSQANKEMPKTLKQLLGQTNEEALESNDQIIEQNVETVRQLSESRRATKDLERQNKTITEKEKVVNKLRDQLEKSTSPSERKRLDEEINKVKRDLTQERAMNQNNAEIENGENQEEIERLEAENERLGEQNEEIFSRMSLRDKVKYIFKKYGLTIFGVLAAVGTVIGVIVSNLKAGLTNVAKGVGNGLKELGKKLGQILLGMVGAIVSFLFKAAGEAVGFLAKHAWLLIMLVVTFAVEQLKN